MTSETTSPEQQFESLAKLARTLPEWQQKRLSSLIIIEYLNYGSLFQNFLEHIHEDDTITYLQNSYGCTQLYAFSFGIFCLQHLSLGIVDGNTSETRADIIRYLHQMTHHSSKIPLDKEKLLANAMLAGIDQDIEQSLKIASSIIIDTHYINSITKCIEYVQSLPEPE